MKEKTCTYIKAGNVIGLSALINEILDNDYEVEHIGNVFKDEDGCLNMLVIYSTEYYPCID